MAVCRTGVRAAVLALVASRGRGSPTDATDMAADMASFPPQLPDAAFLQSVARQVEFPDHAYTVSGTHFAQGYTSESATEVNPAGMKADCDNININTKLSADFRSDVFGPGVKGFFHKCRKVGNRNKYWFTISSPSIGTMIKLCDSKTEYPIVHDEQHDTYWRDLPFKCHGAPNYALDVSSSAFLGEVGHALSLPKDAYTVSGTHFAQGYTSDSATEVSPAGMKADCDNININKKLSADFRSDVLGPGIKGFFFKCERVGNRNKNWFTISTESHSNVVKLCDNRTTYPIVYDKQHDTYWRDEPFLCEGM